MPHHIEAVESFTATHHITWFRWAQDELYAAITLIRQSVQSDLARNLKTFKIYSSKNLEIATIPLQYKKKSWYLGHGISFDYVSQRRDLAEDNLLGRRLQHHMLLAIEILEDFSYRKQYFMDLEIR